MLQQQLPFKWTFWNCYAKLYSQGNREKNYQGKQDYSKNLEKMFTVSTLPQISYVLAHSNLADINKYIIDVQSAKAPKYQYQNQWRKVEAISFFRDPIEPTWEFGQNSNGGQFFTVFSRQSREQTTNIYQSLILQLAFNRFKLAEEILGARFVQRTNAKFNETQLKVEVWVSFDRQQTDKIEVFCEDFGKFCTDIDWQFKGELAFRNNV